ncbi:MAG: hypothetical protein DWQ07_22380 [Chloroflexi bacterium]|nr:MAG: hypothetical protein DWQ07_22380 [Chloroflexota bacterium]MBL1193896.1 hypothetical protein [Chloroflexota bacterium]NOH11190.1 hypothetical protein [Chloroflexota bacterium]
MDNDNLVKRVEWLDEERLNDKNTISDLLKRIAKLEGALDKANQEIKDAGSEVTRLGVMVAKVDDFDDALKLHRAEVKKELGDQEKQGKKREEEIKKVLRIETDAVNKAVEETRKELEALPKMEEQIKLRIEEEARLNKGIDGVRATIDEVLKNEKEFVRTTRSLEDDRRQDNKRLTDLQGEFSAIRKRSDESQAKIDLALEAQKKIEARQNELLAAERERREAQTEFIDKMTFAQAERERAWKDWQKRFDIVESQSTALEERLKELDVADRELVKAQQTFEELTEQLNRRINEITEIQRLGEERLRQEWATFKADDQKRWTNYTLTQDEQQKEAERQIEKLGGQATDLEDNLQELQDIVQHLSEQSEKQLQGLSAMLRDWTAENERFFSSLG